MKRIVCSLAILSLAIFACTIPFIPTPTPLPLPSATLAPTQTATLTETPTVTELPTATATLTNEGPAFPLNNAFCDKLSVYVDPALASSTTCEIVPASQMMEIYPQYSKMTLQGYPLQGMSFPFPATISFFSVQDYTALLPDHIAGLVTDMNALISGGLPGSTSLPFLPMFNAAQTFHSNYAQLPFLSGNGIRFLTLFAQYFAPINNNDLFYTYQGLTSDGKYWVSAILPVNHPILPADAVNPPGGQTWEQFTNNYAAYQAAMITQLEAQTPDSFTPSLLALDGMISTITIQP
jgi:hypothetical protein